MQTMAYFKVTYTREKLTLILIITLYSCVVQISTLHIQFTVKSVKWSFKDR